MTEGPFGGPRPFANAEVELNIYFEDQLYDKTVEQVYKAVGRGDLSHLEGPVNGPLGERKNIISCSMTGNQLSLNKLDTIKSQVENRTGQNIRDIEVII